MQLKVSRLAVRQASLCGSWCWCYCQKKQDSSRTYENDDRTELESVHGPQPPPPRDVRLTSQDSATSDKQRSEGLTETAAEHNYLQLIADPESGSQNEVCRLLSLATFNVCFHSRYIVHFIFEHGSLKSDWFIYDVDPTLKRSKQVSSHSVWKRLSNSQLLEMCQ